MLEKFSLLPKASRERVAAERALTALRETRKPSAELGSIRTELLTLQRENRELRKEMDDLKKKLEALTPALTTKDGKPEKVDKAAAKSTKR